MSYNQMNAGGKIGGLVPYLQTGVDVAIADGGTGASDAAGARSNLGLGSMATQGAGAVAITGGTMSNVAITGLANPTNAGDAASKSYVDAVKTGLYFKDAVRVATASALPGYTFGSNALTASGNGALSIDGVSVQPGDRVLVTKETAGNAKYNGIFVVTDAGSAGTPWILTRAADADVDAEVKSGLFTFVTEGTAGADSGYVLATDGAITVNTTSLSFVQFSSAGTILAGSGLQKVGSTISALLDGTTLAASGSGLKVNPNGITSTEINGGAVTLAKIARSASVGQLIVGQGSGADAQYQAVGGDATLDGAGNLTIANNAITSAKINGGAITQSKMAANSVGSGEIIDGSVGNAELANTAVTPAKADLAQAWTHTGSLIANGGMYLKAAVSTTNVTIDAATTVMAITDTSSARTVTLPAVSGNNGRIIVVKDATGAAGTNNITVDANASETIDGQLTYVINTNYGSVTLVGDPSGWFVV